MKMTDAEMDRHNAETRMRAIMEASCDIEDSWGAEDLEHLSNAEIKDVWDAITSMQRAVKAEMDRRRNQT